MEMQRWLPWTNGNNCSKWRLMQGLGISIISHWADSRGSPASPLGCFIAHILKAYSENIKRGDEASCLTAEKQTKCQSTT